MDEAWKSVVGFDGVYEVSSEGRVRSLTHARVTSQGVKTWAGKMLCPFKDSNGYLYVNLSNGKRVKKRSVHSLVLEAFVGACPDGLQCRHRDGDRTNPKLANLRWGTPLENGADRVEHGTSCKGERNSQAKLSAKQVENIRASSMSSLAIAKDYNVAGSTIRAVRLRINWSHQ